MKIINAQNSMIDFIKALMEYPQDMKQIVFPKIKHGRKGVEKE